MDGRLVLAFIPYVPGMGSLQYGLTHVTAWRISQRVVKRYFALLLLFLGATTSITTDGLVVDQLDSLIRDRTKTSTSALPDGPHSKSIWPQIESAIYQTVALNTVTWTPSIPSAQAGQSPCQSQQKWDSTVTVSNTTSTSRRTLASTDYTPLDSGNLDVSRVLLLPDGSYDFDNTLVLSEGNQYLHVIGGPQLTRLQCVGDWAPGQPAILVKGCGVIIRNLEFSGCQGGPAIVFDQVGCAQLPVNPLTHYVDIGNCVFQQGPISDGSQQQGAVQQDGAWAIDARSFAAGLLVSVRIANCTFVSQSSQQHAVAVVAREGQATVLDGLTVLTMAPAPESTFSVKVTCLSLPASPGTYNCTMLVQKSSFISSSLLLESTAHWPAAFVIASNFTSAVFAGLVPPTTPIMPATQPVAHIKVRHPDSNVTLPVVNNITVAGCLFAGIVSAGNQSDVLRIELDMSGPVELGSSYPRVMSSITVFQSFFMMNTGSPDAYVLSIVSNPPVVGAQHSLVIANCEFTGNARQLGQLTPSTPAAMCNGSLSGGNVMVALKTDKASTTILDSKFTGNSGCGPGGAILLTSPGRTTVLNTTFIQNAALQSGGLHYELSTDFENYAADAVLSLINVTAYNNTAVMLSGGFGTSINAVVLLMYGCDFRGNAALNGGLGGALFTVRSLIIIVTNSTFMENVAATGGALYSDLGSFAYLGSATFLGNRAVKQDTSSSQGMYAIQDESSWAGFGGALYWRQVADIIFTSDSYIDNFIGKNLKAAVPWAVRLPTTRTQTVFDGNWAAVSGGGMVLARDLNIYTDLGDGQLDLVFKNNTAPVGGAATIISYNYVQLGTQEGTMRILFQGNKAVSGGAVHFPQLPQLNTSFYNTIFDGNQALPYLQLVGSDKPPALEFPCGEGGGGAACLEGNGRIVLSGVAFQNNMAVTGGALFVHSTPTCVASQGRCVPSILWLPGVQANPAAASPSVSESNSRNDEPQTDRLAYADADGTAPDPSLVLTRLHNNTAIGGAGGMLYWSRRAIDMEVQGCPSQPQSALDTNQTATADGLPNAHICPEWERDNRALAGGYGDVLASAAIHLQLDQAYMPRRLYVSNQPLSFKVNVCDYYGQLVTSTSDAMIDVQVSMSDTTLTQVITTTNGSRLTTNLQLRSMSGEHIVRLSATGAYHQLSPAYFNLTIPPCAVNQKLDPISMDSCLPCEVDEFSFNSSATTCQRCPANARCNRPFANGTFAASGMAAVGALVPDEGYWHSNMFSDQVHPCPLKEACSYAARRAKLLDQIQASFYNAQQHILITPVGLQYNSFQERTGQRARMLQQGTSADRDAPMEGLRQSWEAYLAAQCSPGYANNLCASCAPGYGSTMSEVCSRCPAAAVNSLLYALATLVTLVGLAIAVQASLAAFTIADSNPSSPTSGMQDIQGGSDGMLGGQPQMSQNGVFWEPGMQVVAHAPASTANADAQKYSHAHPPASNPVRQFGSNQKVGLQKSWEAMTDAPLRTLRSIWTAKNASSTASGNSSAANSRQLVQPTIGSKHQASTEEAHASNEGPFDAGRSTQHEAASGTQNIRHRYIAHAEVMREGHASIEQHSRLPEQAPSTSATNRRSAVTFADQSTSGQYYVPVHVSNHSSAPTPSMAPQALPAPTPYPMISAEQRGPSAADVVVEVMPSPFAASQLHLQLSGSAASTRQLPTAPSGPDVAKQPLTANNMDQGSAQRANGNRTIVEAVGSGRPHFAGNERSASFHRGSLRAHASIPQTRSWQVPDDQDSSQSASTVLKILISYMQVMALLRGIPLKYPSAMMRLFTMYLQITSVIGGLVSLDCSIKATPKLSLAVIKTLVQVLSPWALMAIIMLYFTLQALAKYYQSTKLDQHRQQQAYLITAQALAPQLFDTASPATNATQHSQSLSIRASQLAPRPSSYVLQYQTAYLQQHCLVTLLVAIFYFYPSVMTSLMSIFSCETIDVSGTGNVWAEAAGLSVGSYWTKDYQQLCYKGQHATLAWALGIPGLFLFVAGFPVFSAVWLRFNVRRHNDAEFQAYYSSLYLDYNPIHYYWESVIMLRKLAVAALVVFMSDFSLTLQVLVVMAVLFLAIAVQLSAWPFRQAVMNQLEVLSIGTTILSLYLSLFLLTDPDGEGPGPVAISLLVILINAGTLLVMVALLLAAYYRAYLYSLGLHPDIKLQDVGFKDLQRRVPNVWHKKLGMYILYPAIRLARWFSQWTAFGGAASRKARVRSVKFSLGAKQYTIGVRKPGTLQRQADRGPPQ